MVNVILALATLLAYQLCYSADVGHWMAGFIMLATPALFIANIIFALFWLFTNYKKMWLSVLIIAIGIPLTGRFFQLSNAEKTIISGSAELSVLSYNVMYCDVNSYVHGNEKENAKKLLAVMDSLQADVKCFQELYNWDGEGLKGFRTIYNMTDTHPYYTYMHSTPDNNEGQGEIGLAIFSKYPIINKQEAFWKWNNNGMMLADIVIKKDTIRIINLQMHSMGIRMQKVIDGKSDESVVKKETRNIISQLKTGFEKRHVQTDEVLKWLNESPYPVILCGDLNEIPFGYAYGSLHNKLANSFENAGRGFGFTYNKLPSIIRIDNQFYDASKIENYAFKTFDTVPYSDHYPILGKYVVR